MKPKFVCSEWQWRRGESLVAVKRCDSGAYLVWTHDPLSAPAQSKWIEGDAEAFKYAEAEALKIEARERAAEMERACAQG